MICSVKCLDQMFSLTNWAEVLMKVPDTGKYTKHLDWKVKGKDVKLLMVTLAYHSNCYFSMIVR